MTTADPAFLELKRMYPRTLETCRQPASWTRTAHLPHATHRYRALPAHERDAIEIIRVADGAEFYWQRLLLFDTVPERTGLPRLRLANGPPRA